MHWKKKHTEIYGSTIQAWANNTRIKLYSENSFYCESNEQVFHAHTSISIAFPENNIKA